MTQLELPKTATSSPASRADHPRDARPSPKGAVGRSLSDLRRGPRIILRYLTDEPRPAYQIADSAGFFRVVVRCHLLELEAAGLAVKTEGGWKQA